MDEARSRHGHGRAFGFGQREPQVLDGERHSHSWGAVSLIDNLPAVSLVDSGIKQRIRQHIVSEVTTDPAFSQKRQHLAHALERRCGKHICGELHKVRQCGVFPNNEQSLPEALEQRTYLFQRRGRACGEDEELSGPCEVRIPKHRRGDVILTTARMLLGDPAGQGRADRARGNVDRIRGENSRQPLRPERDGIRR